MPRIICRYCQRSFQPDPRTIRFQKACHRLACRKTRQAANYRRWIALHPDYDRSRQAKVRAWAAAAQYWRCYRKSHPDYAKRDNDRRRRAYRRSVFSAKQITITELTRRKLQELAALKEPISSAKQIAIDGRVNRILDFLLWKELSAKQKSIDLPPAQDK